MKGLKKTVAVAVTAAMALSMTSCSLFGSKIKTEDIVSAGEDFAKQVVSMDAKKMSKLSADVDQEDIEDAFDFGLEYHTDDQMTIIDAIIDTIEYTVDEESIEKDKESATADIIFTMVDYEAVLDDEDNMEDLDTCLDAIADCEDTIEITIEAEFELDDEELLVANPEDFADVFEFVDDIDCEFIVPINWTIDEAFWYNAPDGVYSNPWYIEYDVTFEDYSLEGYVTFTYSYNGQEIYSEDYYCYGYGFFYLSAYSSEVIDDNGYMAEGTYTIEVVDENGEVIATDSCEVSHEEVDAEFSWSEWYMSDDGVYTSDAYYIEYDIYFTAYTNSTGTFTYYYNGEEIYSEDNYYFSDYGFLYLWADSIGEDSMPAGTYDITITFDDGSFTWTDSCVVE